MRLSSGRLIQIGAVSGFLSVALGAFAAHGLRTRLSERMLNAFETGVEYQFYHAFALILLGLCAGKLKQVWVDRAGGCFLLGIFLFSGSLYLLTVTGLKGFAYITPFGGVLFLLGWLSFALGARSCK